MIPYWVWVPLVIADYFACAYFTRRINDGSNGWIFVMWAIQSIPLWALICRFSRNIVFDGMVFDVTMTITYTLSILYFTQSFQKLCIRQYVGCAAILVGLFLFKKAN